MSTEIVPFSFEGHEVRTAVVDGQPWWVLTDVARALGVHNGRDLLARLDDDEKGVERIDTLGGAQQFSVVNEPGLYSVVLRSDKPEAKRFKRWLTHEVLPAIRQTGSYVAPAAPKSEMDIIREQHSAIGTLLEYNERMQVELTTAAPKAEAWDELAAAKGDFAVGEAAKMLARAGVPTGPQRLFDQLAAMHWIFRSGHGTWEPYANIVDVGHLASKPQSHEHPKTGERIIDPPQVRVTIKGLERLRQRLHVGALKAVSA